MVRTYLQSRISKFRPLSVTRYVFSVCIGLVRTVRASGFDANPNLTCGNRSS